jgi:hypothetical protein
MSLSCINSVKRSGKNGKRPVYKEITLEAFKEWFGDNIKVCKETKKSLDKNLLKEGSFIVQKLCENGLETRNDLYCLYLDYCRGIISETGRIDYLIEPLQEVFKYLDICFTNTSIINNYGGYVSFVVEKPILYPNQNLKDSYIAISKYNDWIPIYQVEKDADLIKTEFSDKLLEKTIVENDKNSLNTGLDDYGVYDDWDLNNVPKSINDLKDFMRSLSDKWASGETVSVEILLNGYEGVREICTNNGCFDTYNSLFIIFLDYCRGISGEFGHDSFSSRKKLYLWELRNIFSILDTCFTNTKNDIDMIRTTKVPKNKLCKNQSLEECIKNIEKDPFWIPDYQLKPLYAGAGHDPV